MRRATFLIVSTLLLLPGLLSAQSAEEWYLDKPIKDFTFSGLVTVFAKDLRPIVEGYIGKKFTMDLFWEAQGKLFALDEFESIEGEAVPADEAKSAVIVNFKVTERPTVGEIVLEGNSQVRSSDILDAILIKKGDLVSTAKVKADETAIKDLYLGKGYTDVAVTGKIDTDQAGNKATVSFQITEGAQTTVKEILFSGNSFAAASTLRNLMKTKPPLFLIDTGEFQESKLEGDKKAIIDYYTDHGYIDARIERVDRSVQSEGGKNLLTLTVYIVEGRQWTYGGMSFQGNSVFSSSRLEDLLTQKPGKIMSLKKFNEDFMKITSLYGDNGYVFNSFEKIPSRNEETGTISYLIKITEQDKAYIENIIFKGNKKTKDFVLRRELPFEEGDIFDIAKIQQGLRNLYFLQFFSSIVPETPNGSVPGLVNLVVNVEEESKVDLKFGMQFSGTSFPGGYINWNDPNFNGTGQTFGAGLTVSPTTQSVSLNYLEPWMFGVRWSLGASLSFSHSLMQNIPQDVFAPIFTDEQSGIAAPDPYGSLDEYKAAKQAGLSIPAQYLMSYESLDTTLTLNTGYRWQIPLGYFGTVEALSFRLRWLTYDPTLFRPYDVTIRNNLNTVNLINQLSTIFYLDGRDTPVNATTGFQISQGLTYTGGLLFGSRQYNRTDSTLQGFLTLFSIPFSEEWSLQAVLAAQSSLSLLWPQYGFIAPTGASEPSWQVTDPIVDPTDLLYIDGMNIGRGWGQMFGQALWDNKLELRVPIIKEYIWAAAYFDGVGLWQEPSDMLSMNIDQFYFSFGIGIRLAIPQLPIRLYFGKEFQYKDGQVVWKTGILGDPNGFNFDFIISIQPGQTVGPNSF